MNEDTLGAAALRGDRTAWDALIRRHDHRVVVALLARGVALDRARDLAQETWMRLMEQQRAGRLQAIVLPGLAVTQALFLARDDARRHAGAAQLASVDVSADALRSQLRDPGADAEARLLDAERLARAAAAFAKLSPGAQRVFRRVCERSDHPQAVVANELGLSLQRVRQIVCEVRRSLRAAVEESEHG